MIKSERNATTQQEMATGKRPAPKKESAIPAISAKSPAQIESDAPKIAGNVITEIVMYGT